MDAKRAPVTRKPTKLKRELVSWRLDHRVAELSRDEIRARIMRWVESGAEISASPRPGKKPVVTMHIETLSLAVLQAAADQLTHQTGDSWTVPQVVSHLIVGQLRSERRMRHG